MKLNIIAEPRSANAATFLQGTRQENAATFIQGVGQYSFDEMLAGVSWLGATETELLAGLNGVGALAQGADQQFIAPQSVMNAIIKNAKEMQDKQNFLANARMRVAKSDPEFAMKLNAVMQKTAAPGTNVAAGVVQTAIAAAKKATVAKDEEKDARALLKSGDKRGAAAMAVKAMQTARDALILSTKAEKTRLAVSLDSVAGTLESQAKYIEAVTEAERIARGSTSRTDSLTAAALSLRDQASKLRAQSAVVAATPDVPPTAPTNQRIAEVANKFNLRSAGRRQEEHSREVVSVLADLSNSALAQVKDYSGALTFYGNDGAGRVMADIEFDNMTAALQGLAQAVHGVGYVDTLPVFARADRALAMGVKAAQQGYVNAVLPTYMGSNPTLSQVQAKAAQLGGLNLAGLGGTQEEWSGWCDRQVNSGRPGSEPITAAYKGDVNMCKKWGIFYSEPWSCKGIWERGGMDIGAMALCMVKGVPKFFTSGEAQKVISTVDDVAKTVNTVVAPTPPATTKPPVTLPVPGYSPPGYSQPNGGGPTPGNYSGGYGQQGYGMQQNFGGSGNTALYAGLGVGALALGFGVWYTMFRR